METLIQRLEKLAPGIVARREEIEAARRMPADLVKALRDTGLFSLEIPRALGGQEAEPLEVLRAIETVSRADGSTGWCAAQGLAGNGLVAYVAEEGAREVFADPRSPTASAFAPSGAAVRVEGGVKVSGRWPFVSGVHHAEWVMAGCLVMENGQPRMTPMGPEAIHVWLPAKSIEILDTWVVSGLCGTGSHDFTARDVFVPDRRVFLVGDPARCRPEPLCRMPPLAFFVSHVAAVSLGIARGALDEVTQIAQKRVPTFTMAVLADQPVAQVELARAEATLAAARALLHESVADVWRVVRTGEQPAPRQVALIRVAALNAAEAGAAVTRKAGLLGGGGAIYTASALQRHTRDAEALTHHFCLSPGVWEDAGRVFMGRKPNAPMF
jgi:alkylation response protein AidB-like acyl-CoA dehydrogenase